MCLVTQCLHYLRMAVSLIDGGIGRKEIKIAFSFHIPYKRALALAKDYGQRMIIMGTVTVFHFDKFF